MDRLEEKIKFIYQILLDNDAILLPIQDEMEKVLKKTFKENDIKGMRMILKDFKEWMKGLELKKREKAESDYYGLFGEYLYKKTKKNI